MLGLAALGGVMESIIPVGVGAGGFKHKVSAVCAAFAAMCTARGRATACSAQPQI
jgi:hypothetical protein